MDNISFTSYIKPTKYFESGVKYTKMLAQKKDIAAVEKFCNAVDAIKNDGKKDIFDISVEKGFSNFIKNIKREKIFMNGNLMSDKVLPYKNDGQHCYNSIISFAKEYLNADVEKLGTIHKLDDII